MEYGKWAQIPPRTARPEARIRQDKEDRMSQKWTPAAINRLVTVATGCLCLPILLLGVLILISQNKLSAALLGTATGMGVGGGLLGLAAILALVIKSGLNGGE